MTRFLGASGPVPSKPRKVKSFRAIYLDHQNGTAFPFPFQPNLSDSFYASAGGFAAF